MKRAYEGIAWHGPSVRELLNGVTAETAAARPLAGAHSIWEIVLHSAAWEAAVRRRLQGQPIELTPEEDWPAVTDTGEAAWQAALAALDAGDRQLREAISHLSDADLDKTVEGQPYTIYFMLHGVIQHDLYHAGQIGLLKKARVAGTS